MPYEDYNSNKSERARSSDQSARLKAIFEIRPLLREKNDMSMESMGGFTPVSDNLISASWSTDGRNGAEDLRSLGNCFTRSAFLFRDSRLGNILRVFWRHGDSS